MIDVTKFVETLDGKPVAVFGLGMSNLAAIRALVAAGASVTAWDDNPEAHKKAQSLGADIQNLTQLDLSGYDCLVLAPGVPFMHKPHPVVQKAHEAGIEILCDIEILHRCGHGIKTVGVTGTNGKSTTTVLIAFILKKCGVNMAAGGNIGKPALALELPQGEKSAIVLELSSYQLDLCPTFAPDIAVLLNISPDHIDRHGTMEHYIAAKKRIFRGEGQAIIGEDDEYARAMSQELRQENIRRVHGISCEDAGIGMIAVPALRGMHNHQNMAAAYQTARLLGLKHDEIIAAIQRFPGLPHRQYPVRTIGGVSFINDSKATNADAAARALDSFENIYWIAGGRAKDGGLQGLEAYRDNVAHTYLIGEAADDFAGWCESNDFPFTRCGDMAAAIDAAYNDAREKGGIVLLSPACASFDQYKSFEERGDHFTALVKDLKEKAA